MCYGSNWWYPTLLQQSIIFLVTVSLISFPETHLSFRRTNCNFFWEPSLLVSWTINFKWEQFYPLVPRYSRLTHKVWHFLATCVFELLLSIRKGVGTCPVGASESQVEHSMSWTCWASFVSENRVDLKNTI